ncbi:type II secretion system ATPase GspE [Indioceanicola profundi]|uniref:type II secretion system ATPase GspE n=1 Tax=Indioceanicola profundi TaxID=2220096 RepID=UPI000E6AACAC|nr:type II secretion system ATPase GspE [Indioceanicola profundi]
MRADPILSYAFARDRGVILLDGQDGAGRALVGLADRADPLALVEVRRALGRPFAVERLSAAEFDRRLSESYAVDGLASAELAQDIGADGSLDALVGELPPTADLLDTDDDAPIIQLINGVIAEAVKSRSSDVHLEPYETRLAVRLRVDGVLREILELPARLAPLVISRVKVMARLDIAERRIPQDGRVSLAIGGRSIDVRVSTLPSRHGERVVLRLLDKEQAKLDVADLGMPPAVLAAYRRALAAPNGIILVTGPTGSGKTTTLYAGLATLNDGERNILTIEDPVEYALQGVGQTQVNPKVGMTFAAGLRAILRQDPDVVMVGEIRDVETAQIAVQASLTGHLVLSTVHTSSAVGAVTRLRDMGVEPFLLASSLKAILAQRLVRRLCPACKQAHPADPAEMALLRQAGEPPMLHRPAGCSECKGTGYRGRIGLYELAVVDGELRRLIHDDAAEADLAAAAFGEGDTLLAAGLARVLAGDTALEEVLRVVRREDEVHGGV